MATLAEKRKKKISNLSIASSVSSSSPSPCPLPSEGVFSPPEIEFKTEFNKKSIDCGDNEELTEEQITDLFANATDKSANK